MKKKEENIEKSVSSMLLVEEKDEQIENKRQGKKKVWILVLVFLVLFVLGSFLYVKKDKLFGCNGIWGKNCEFVLDDDAVQIREKLILNSGDVLDIHRFFNEEIELIDAKITFVNRDEMNDEKDLVVSETNVVIGVGTFDVEILVGEKTYTSVLKVLDKTAPILEVKDVEIVEGEQFTKDNFVVSCEDNSKAACILSALDDEGKEVELDTSVGTRKYVIVARDESGNETKKEVTLTVTKKEKENDNTGSNSSTNKTGSTSGSNNNSSGGKKIVSTKNETEESFEEAKYGTRYKVTRTIKVTTYSDGTETRKTVKTSKVLDSSSFKASSKELEAEARSVTASNSSAYQEMITYVNQYREEVGSKPLVLNKELSVLATIRAIEMAYADTFSHTRPDGRHWGSVGDDMGFGMMILGENIAYGTGGYNNTALKAATNWRNSPGHYSNMIASGYGNLGVGKYTLNGKTYWVQLFCG